MKMADSGSSNISTFIKIRQYLQLPINAYRDEPLDLLHGVAVLMYFVIHP